MIDIQMPVVASYFELYNALAPLHMHEKQWVDRLHDLWRNGPPSPESQLKAPKLFDERKSDVFNAANGNVMQRLVRAEFLSVWIKEAAQARGIQITNETAGQIVNGRYEIVGNN